MTLNRKNNHTNGISVFKLVKNEVLHEIVGLLCQNIIITRLPTAAILL